MLERPITFVFIVVAAIVAVNLGSAATAAIFSDLPHTGIELIAESALAVAGGILLWRQRSWRSIGFRRLTRVRDLRLYWVLLIPLLPALPAAALGISRIATVDVLLFLLLACVVGFVEEVYFRGFILQALTPAGPWSASIIASALFGSMHLLNLAFGADLGATLLQAAYAAALGFAFAAVTLRTGVLWPLIVIHSLVDFAGFVTSGQPS